MRLPFRMFFARVRALCWKEVLQLLRDRTTLGMLIGVPLIQVLLFGFAIELTPRQLPVVVVTEAPAAATGLEGLLHDDRAGIVVQHSTSLSAARASLQQGTALLVIDADALPVRVWVDATDPVLASHAIAVVERLAAGLNSSAMQQLDPSASMTIEKLFNPTLKTQPYLVSGLLGLILTMTLVMMSALTVARERERGTLEGLAVLRVRPLELAIGKLLPYLFIGAVQGLAIMLVARLAFDIRMVGSPWLLTAATGLFAVANLALGFLFSNLAPAQMPAMQMTFFFFLPSSLLSGFMFPFAAMPQWAQQIGELLPLTHFLRVARGLVLQGQEVSFVMHEMRSILLFAVVVLALALVSCARMLRRAAV